MSDQEKTMVDALKELAELNKVEYTNAPETLELAIERLARAEFLLEDLARGAELAEITKNTNLTGVFRTAAEEYLLDKLAIKDKKTQEDTE